MGSSDSITVANKPLSAPLLNFSIVNRRLRAGKLKLPSALNTHDQFQRKNTKSGRVRSAASSSSSSAEVEDVSRTVCTTESTMETSS